MLNKIIYKIKRIIYYYFDTFNIRGNRFIKLTESLNSQDKVIYPESDIIVGIVKEEWNMHHYYIKACQELRISYILIDIFKNNWFTEINQLQVDFIVIRPSVQYDVWKALYDNRLKILTNSTSFKFFPSNMALWLWESKLHTIDWLKAMNLPHPTTWIFYRKKEAVEFGANTDFPVVYKSNSGSGASGVKIIKSKRELKKQIKRCFSKGVRTYRKHILDKEHGFIILQEFIENVNEWRIIRIGRYYVGYQKVRNGSFHSGSGMFSYGMPPDKCLNLVKNLTDKYGFYYVDIDVFIRPNGEILVNEIQPYFGQKDDRELLLIDGKPGRLYYDKKWIFEEGKFCRNNMCNLRLNEMINEIKNQKIID